jgi:dTMP kinase
MPWRHGMSGLFVTFEGVDGCGKSTQVTAARRMLLEKEVPCMVTREPGGTAISEQIRGVLLSPRNSEMCNPCEVLLYCAARAQHVYEAIEPALATGSVVLCDRFMDATFAYQGFARGIPLKLLTSINRFATGGIAPSLSFVFDIDVDTAFARLKKTDKLPDRIEGSGREFFEKVRSGYLELASMYPKRIVVLNGTASVEELSDVVLETILRSLRKIKRSLGK